MPATTRLALPWPADTDSADVPQDIQELAEALDLVVAIYSFGTFAARPGSTVAGHFYRATDTGAMYFWDTAWRDLTTIADNSIVFAKLHTTVVSNINRIGILADRPAAAAVVSGTKYFATDQVVDYISDGASWIRTSTPAGITADWFKPDAAVPTGWVLYDGGNLPASTGIYADLYAHLGNTLVKPDTQGRSTIGKGTHTDVDAIGDSDGLAAASRSPKHNTTVTGAPAIGSLAVSGAPSVGSLAVGGSPVASSSHTHDVAIPTEDAHDSGGVVPVGQDGTFTSGVPSATQALTVTGAPGLGSLAVSGAPAIGSLDGGPGGTRPEDQIGFITCSKIAKL